MAKINKHVIDHDIKRYWTNSRLLPITLRAFHHERLKDIYPSPTPSPSLPSDYIGRPSLFLRNWNSDTGGMFVWKYPSAPCKTNLITSDLLLESFDPEITSVIHARRSIFLKKKLSLGGMCTICTTVSVNVVVGNGYHEFAHYSLLSICHTLTCSNTLHF